MYKQYLVDFKKLIYLVGQDSDTELVKNSLQNIPEKFNSQLITCKQINFDNKRKVNTSSKYQSSYMQTGIIKSYWFQKILKKEPMVIILIFNHSKPLDPMQKLQDRLYETNKTIFSIRENLRINNKKNMSLQILILIGQSAIGGISVVDKSKQYLKITDRSLQFVNIDFLKNDAKKLRMLWFNHWDKLFQQRLKKRQRKWQQAQKQQIKLACQIKLCVMHDIINKQNFMTTYQNTYFLCRRLFFQIQKKKNQDLELYLNLYQLRTIGDFLILKIFKHIAKNKVNQAFDRLITHFSEFKNKNFSQLKGYYYYQQLQWRVIYLSTIIQCVYFPPLNIGQKQKLKACQLINGILNYRLQLVSIKDEIVAQKMLSKQESIYFGKYNYKISANQKFQYIQDTRIAQIISQRQNHIQNGIALIMTGKLYYKKYEQMYLNMVLLRFYLLTSDVQQVLRLYNQIVEFYYTKGQYFVLNYLLKQIQDSLEITKQRTDMLKFYLIAIKISDYFKNTDRLYQFANAIKHITAHTVNQAPVYHRLNSYSYMGRFSIQIPIQSIKLNQKVIIKLKFQCHESFNNFFTTMDVQFKNDKIKIINRQIINQMLIEFQPFNHIDQDDIIQIKQITLKSNKHNLCALISNQQITYKKHRKMFIINPLQDPNYKSHQKYKKVYVNEIFPINFLVSNENQNSKIDAKIYFNQEQGQGIQVYRDLYDKINLVNTMTSAKLQNSKNNTFYLKSNSIGDKKIKIICNITVQKKFLNSKNQQKILKKIKKFNQQIKFSVSNIFTIKKKFKIPNSEILTKLIKFDNERFQIPHNQKVFVHVQIKSEENIIITSLKQEQLDSNIIFLKSLNIQNINLEKRTDYKAISIIKVNKNFNDSILPPYLIKWRRKQQDIQNIYKDIQQKIRPLDYSISLQLKQIQPMKKGFISSVHYNLTNYLPSKLKLRLFFIQNDTFFLVGKNRFELIINENSSQKLSIKLIPLILGQISMPQITVRVNDEKQNSEYRIRKKELTFVN